VEFDTLRQGASGVGAFAEADAVFSDDDRRAARRNADFIRSSLWDAEHAVLHSRWRDGDRDKVVMGVCGPVDAAARAMPRPRNGALAHVCIGTACQPPVDDPAALQALLADKFPTGSPLHYPMAAFRVRKRCRT
jgi:uncharacterized protein YyaL (SSP411 family)